MKQVQPAEFRSLQVAANYVNAGFSDPVALTQKHARILRMSVLRAKRTRLSNPGAEPCIGFNPQMVDPASTNQSISQPGGVEVGNSSHSDFDIHFCPLYIDQLLLHPIYSVVAISVSVYMLLNCFNFSHHS